MGTEGATRRLNSAGDRTNLACEMRTKLHRRTESGLRLRRAIMCVWCYAIGLFLVVGTLAISIWHFGLLVPVSQSTRLLVPVGGVCFAGGVIGTIMAYLHYLHDERPSDPTGSTTSFDDSSNYQCGSCGYC